MGVGGVALERVADEVVDEEEWARLPEAAFEGAAFSRLVAAEQR